MQKELALTTELTASCEVPPKWTMLTEVLQEISDIRSSGVANNVTGVANNVSGLDGKDVSADTDPVLIIVKDKRTRIQVFCLLALTQHHTFACLLAC